MSRYQQEGTSTFRVVYNTFLTFTLKPCGDPVFLHIFRTTMYPWTVLIRSCLLSLRNCIYLLTQAPSFHPSSARLPYTAQLSLSTTLATLTTGGRGWLEKPSLSRFICDHFLSSHHASSFGLSIFWLPYWGCHLFPSFSIPYVRFRPSILPIVTGIAWKPQQHLSSGHGRKIGKRR